MGRIQIIETFKRCLGFLGYLGWGYEQFWYRKEVTIARYNTVKEETTRESLM